MPYTNFIGSGAAVNGAPLIPGGGQLPVANNYWFVNSVTGSNGYPGTADQPFATLAFAITQATAAIGDCIVLQAGHAETISAAAGIAVNKSGVFIIGLGSGNDRPVFTFGTATSATMTITAANVTVANITATNSLDQIVSPFVISGANCTFGSVEFGNVQWTDSADAVEAVQCILTTAGATNLNVSLKYLGRTGGSHCARAVNLVGVAGAIINADFYGKASTAWVNFTTTACTNVEVYGYMYNSGTTNYTKDVVDTITGSTWFGSFFDGSAGYAVSGGSGSALGPAAAATVIADLGVPAANATANLLERDVIGNKTDTGVTAVGATNSLYAVGQGLITMNTVQSANSTNNAFAGDVVGNKTDAAVYALGTTKSIEAYVKGILDSAGEKCATSSQTGVLATGTTIFTIAGGPIELVGLWSLCTTGGDATAATLLYTTIPTGLAAFPISAASGSVANAPVNATLTWLGTTAATAVTYSSGGNLFQGGPSVATATLAPGVINITVGSGPTTTGTWKHFIRYRPCGTGVTVT